MVTGRFAQATLWCAARGEISDEQAITQALAHVPELHERARHDLPEARRHVATRRGPGMWEANRIIAELLQAAGIQLRPRPEEH